jgi:uncharacterized protein involved in exopolysaccharide biosynthesis
MRAYKIQESLVEVLTKQYELAKLSESRDISPIQIIQKAKAPERKSKPSRRNILLTGMVSAFTLAVALSLILEKIYQMSNEDRYRWKMLFSDLFFLRGIKK